MPGATPAAVQEFMVEQQRLEGLARGNVLRIVGLVTAAAGIGTIIFLWDVVGGQIYTAGMIPLLVGVALLVYCQAFMPRARQ
jgi:hypothetical protein